MNLLEYFIIYYFASDDPSATNEPESDDEDEDEDDDVSKHTSIQSLQTLPHVLLLVLHSAGKKNVFQVLIG